MIDILYSMFSGNHQALSTIITARAVKNNSELLSVTRQWIVAFTKTLQKNAHIEVFTTHIPAQIAARTARFALNICLKRNTFHVIKNLK